MENCELFAHPSGLIVIAFDVHQRVSLTRSEKRAIVATSGNIPLWVNAQPSGVTLNMVASASLSAAERQAGQFIRIGPQVNVSGAMKIIRSALADSDLKAPRAYELSGKAAAEDMLRRGGTFMTDADIAREREALGLQK